MVIYRTGKAAMPEKPKYQLATEPQYPKFWEESDRQVLLYLEKRAEEIGAIPVTFT